MVMMMVPMAAPFPVTVAVPMTVAVMEMAMADAAAVTMVMMMMMVPVVGLLNQTVLSPRCLRGDGSGRYRRDASDGSDRDGAKSEFHEHNVSSSVSSDSSPQQTAACHGVAEPNRNARFISHSVGLNGDQVSLFLPDVAPGSPTSSGTVWARPSARSACVADFSFSLCSAWGVAGHQERSSLR